MRKLTCIAVTLIGTIALSGCAATKVVTLPAKAVVKTGELAGKGVYHTGKFAGKSVYHTGKFAGQSAVATGKGVYYVGMVPVKITDRALDTTTKVLTVTTQAVDLTGSVVTTTHQISAYQLDAELANIKRAKNIIGVTIDAAG